MGLATLPMNRMLLVEDSKMKTMKGLLSFITSGMLMGMISMVVLAAAVVPVSSTLRAARCETWWEEGRGFGWCCYASVCCGTGPHWFHCQACRTFETLSLGSADMPVKSAVSP